MATNNIYPTIIKAVTYCKFFYKDFNEQYPSVTETDLEDAYDVLTNYDPWRKKNFVDGLNPYPRLLEYVKNTEFEEWLRHDPIIRHRFSA